MGYSSSGGPRGRGVFNKTPATVSDFNKVLALLAEWGNIPVGTTAERDALTGGKLYSGLVFSNTTTGTLDRYSGSGWVTAWKGATALGSVAPVAGSGITLTSNNLYTRDGWLLGSIDWAKASTALSHGDVIMTLPVGARPSTDSFVGSILTPSPAVPFQLAVTTGGAVSALSPPTSRTGGSIRFAMAIPL